MPSVDPPTVSLPSKGLLLGEPAFSLLRNYGIPLVPGELTRDVKTAAAFALGVGYPVVLKIVSPEWLHKSDWGGIRLNIGSEAELYTAYDALMALFSERTPDARLDGILVQKQIQGTELLFGIKRDPQFGPVLVVGMGGIYTEVFKDIARMVAPVTAEDVWEMLRSLQIFPILKGARGQKGVHLDALVEVALALSTMATDYPNISELDLNPVLANSDGCWCVDVRVVLGDMSGHEAETQNGTQPREAHA
jgi:acetyltransferase